MRVKASFLLILSAVFLLAFTFFISVYFEIPFGILSKDPLWESGVNPINGMLSNIGAVYWSMSFGICFFAYFTLESEKHRTEQLFLAYSGLFSLLLLIDDLMMVHDKIVPYFLGIDEIYIYALYGFLALFYLVYFRNILVKTNYKYLVVALMLFGASIITDKLEHFIGQSVLYVIEDGTKFIGISFWVTF